MDVFPVHGSDGIDLDERSDVRYTFLLAPAFFSCRRIADPDPDFMARNHAVLSDFKNMNTMRFLFAFILLVHGLIHLLGFLKAFQLADISQLTQPVSRASGVFWLLAALLFVVSAALFLFHKDVWWMFAAPAVVISQILVFMQWHDAKFGTIANIIALSVIVIAFGDWKFKSLINSELKSFLAIKKEEKVLVSKENTSSLPPVVQQWLERSNMIGKPMIRTVHLQQTGSMRTTPEGKWMPVTAEQYFNANQPGFIWIADVQAAPMIHLAGRDRYQDGKGHMLIKLLSLFPVADAKGMETDQGSMLRYLAEIIWFPSAALSQYITWEEIDAHSAKATMTYGGMTASGIFRFTNDGDMQSFDADRYYDRKGGATLEKWHIENTKFEERSDIRMPVASEVSWKLKTGDFTWYKLEIEDVSYDEQ